MGYSTTFRLKKELDSEFIPWVKEVKKSELDKYKAVLLAVCELQYKEDLKDRYSFSLYTLYDKVYFAVSNYVKLISSAWKIELQAKLNENKEIDFYGWEYSKDDSIWENEEDLISFFTKDLFLDIIKPTSGAFDRDNADYDNKIQQIWDQVNEIEDSVWIMLNHKFIRRYRDNEDADEDDGYNHRFPEKIKENEDLDISEQEISNQSD